VKITADTNVLVRAIVANDERQSQVAIAVLESVDLVAISLQSLSEFARVLERHYEIPRADISAAIRRLVETRNVAVNRPAVAAGLDVFDADGDFADGVITYDGEWMGGATFVSFDRKAVSLIAKQGHQAQLLS
jgi:predicted nucleic-acid-binding protein